MAALHRGINMAASKLTKDDIDKALVKFNERFGRKIEKLKPKQYSALLDVVNGHEVIAALPTGYGKSLIYELIPFVLQDTKVIVVEPLNVIINQQISKLDGMAVQLKELNMCKAIKDGHFSYSFIYSHPENLLGKPSVNKFFQSKCFQENGVVIVIDEAHCILEWGDEFRPEYSKLVELRAVLPHATILCLSATLSIKGQADIKKCLSLKDCRIHGEIPVKPNISISVLRRPASSDVKLSYRHILDVLFNELKVKLSATALTIVYFNSSLNYIGLAYEHASRVLGNLLYNGERKPENARVLMYHASVEYGSEELRELIYRQISSEDSPLRIILASSALGMGADFGLVERIVHAGPPKSIEAYIQQVGRTGRTGKQATAILFFNNSDVGRPEMSKTMKSFCRNETTCRRKILNDYFGFTDHDNIEGENKQSSCCNICDPSLTEWNSVLPLRQEVKCSIRQSLADYISSNNLDISPYQVEEIINNYSRYMDTDNSIQDFGLTPELAENLCAIIKFGVSL